MRTHYLPIFLLVVLTFALIAAIPASAIKTAETSVKESLTRGSRFTVTITGIPNSSYYIWLPRTSMMTGEPGNQPPLIADNLLNVRKDPTAGPYSIGSYQYNNGNGRTVRDDVAPSTTAMPSINYYALVTTNNVGQAVVEFQTSINTGLRSYSVKVENPDSIDSDNLQVELQVYSRKAPSVTILTREPTPEPVITTRAVTIIISPPSSTPTPEPMISLPPQTTTSVPITKTTAGLFSITCAILIAAFCIGIRR
jgi:hypothetical protein